ncbi:ADK-domain-containing protein [Obba rivulosa]|uniref:ADK-domain-containing protein n=1 Tax=Obba rivulosa TaxID=1052685 RepID=A0A8E2DSL8_9APHY|nr:ADK-domain-containing protein [Obba rivulosa]
MPMSASAFVVRPAQRHSRTRSRCFGHSAPAQRALPFSLNTGALAKEPSKPESSKVLRMLMFGKPGAGKGTLSARLVKNYDILSLSTGDMLRQHIAEKTDVGRMAEEIVAAGGLLPDDIMLKVVASRLDHLRNKHWILDGFPRTLGQGKLFDGHLRQQGTPLSLIVNLDVPDEVILSRIADRWVHLPSGRVYSQSYNPPKVAGLDDETGEPLTKRPDDNPDTFTRRLQKFYAATAPLLSYFNSHSSGETKVVTLSGVTSDEIWPQLDSVVQGLFPSLKRRTEIRKPQRQTTLTEVIVTTSEKESSQTKRRATQNM